MATYDFQTITAAQALAYDGFVDRLIGPGLGHSLTVSFNDAARQVSLTDPLSGRAVVFGSGLYNGFAFEVGNGGLRIGSPGGDFLYYSNHVYGGAGNDTLSGEQAFGGPGNDLFIVGGSSSSRIMDWEVGDFLFASKATPTETNYVEATKADADAARTFAIEQIADGKDYVVVQVGADLHLFADRRQTDNLGSEAPTIIVGRALSDISQANFVSTAPAVSPAPADPVGVIGYITGDMDALHLSSLVGASIESATATSLVLKAAGAQLTLTGDGFVYEGASQLTGGLTSAIKYASTTFALNLQVKANAASFGGWVARDATQEAFTSLLSGNDALGGGIGVDLLRSYAGDDILYGGSGGDSLFGGTGNDAIYADYAPGLSGPVEAGRTYLRGEDGDDTIIGGAQFDDIHGNVGADSERGAAGDDWVVGGKGTDTLLGDAGADILYGNIGNDLCYGGEGADTLRGGQDDDVLDGGAGADWMSGDRGADTLTGGDGADLFHSFSGAGLDRVLDFSYAAGDRVNLLAGTAYTVSQSGADTIIDLGNGDQIMLVGVSQASLGAGWISVG